MGAPTDPSGSALQFGPRTVYLPLAGALVLADLHLGRAASAGITVPIGGSTDVLERLRAMLSRFEPETVVLAGDVLHAFSVLPAPVVDAVADIEDLVADAGANLVVLAGNHDAMLERATDAEVFEQYRLDAASTIVCHGHERPAGTADRYVIGHEHPAFEIEGRKRPCVLYGAGAYRGGDVIVLPPFSRLPRGVTVGNILREGADSPMIDDIGTFRAGVWDDRQERLRWFPPLAACREFL